MYDIFTGQKSRFAVNLRYNDGKDRKNVWMNLIAP